jgi:hypothetical protein
MGFFDDIGKAWDSARESFERSDIGQVVSTVTRPVTATIEAGGDFVRGAAKGRPIDEIVTTAGRRLGGAYLNANPVSQIINSSSSVKNFLENDRTINRGLGYLPQAAVRSTNAQNQLSTGQNISWDQTRDILNYNAQGVAAAGVIYGATSAASAYSKWAADKKLIEQALYGSTILSAAKKGDAKGVATALGYEIPEVEVPGWVKDVEDTYRNITDPTSPTGTVGSTSPQTYNPWTTSGLPGGGLNSTTSILPMVLAGATLLGIIYLARAKK